MKNNKKRVLIWIFSALAVLSIILAVSYIYLSDYYHADRQAISEFSFSENISEKELDGGAIAFIPSETRAGLIFYPGGKVEAEAYTPLMMSLAEEGILCVLVEMPFNLAVLDINAAEGIKEQFSEIENWYMSGHSLGGSMAASYISKNASDYEGLILIASYSTADISKSDLDVISIYGSEDKVLNGEKYIEYKKNLPDDLFEYVIDGGCHAYFGVYGSQSGDGTPNITNEEQIRITSEIISENIFN